MRSVGACLLASVMAGMVWVQEPEQPAPPVEILQKSWRLEVFNPKLDEDPFAANDQQREFERDQKDNAIRNQAIVREGGTPIQTNRPAKPVSTSAERERATYVYRVKLKNGGAQTIESLVWAYVFLDRQTQEELGRHRYTSMVKIRPGKSRELMGRSSSPPTNVISAAQAGKEPGKQYTEEIVIERLDYTDGSFWQRPVN
jgi:hypothetical protein